MYLKGKWYVKCEWRNVREGIVGWGGVCWLLEGGCKNRMKTPRSLKSSATPALGAREAFRVS